MFRGAKHRLARWFFAKPVVPFAVEFVVLAPLILADNPSAHAGGYVFLLPWLVLLFGVVNVPFVVGAFRAFRLDLATRRNHALEHATIHYLEAGGGKRLSGRAAVNGFRVIGRSSAPEIKSAFEHVRRVVREGGQLPYVSRRCGSNVVTALGLVLVLLLGVASVSVVLRPPLAIRASGLTSVVLLFFFMRHGIGNLIQRRFFMTIDFDEVSLPEIREIKPDPIDRRRGHFVVTNVHVAASTPSNKDLQPAADAIMPRRG